MTTRERNVINERGDYIYVSEYGVGVVCGFCDDFKEYDQVDKQQHGLVAVFWCVCP